MIISPDRNWCYLGIPKTGSTTLVNLFQKPPFGCSYNHIQHDMIPPADISTVLITIRSPWTRILSLWNHRRVELLYSLKENIENHTREVLLSFDGFMLSLFERRLDDFFCRTLCEWLDDCPRTDYRLIKLENLRQDLAKSLPQYDWNNINIPRLNDTDGVKCTTDPLLIQANRNMVWTWAKNDFRRFSFYHIQYNKKPRF
jgi:hypothetical protein